MSASATAESRGSERIPFKVAVQATGEHQFWCGFTTNLSSGGVFVATHAVLPIGTIVEFDFTLGTAEVTVKGEVRWVRTGDVVTPGMGIRFVDLPASVAARIEEVLCQAPDTIFYDDE
jgi:uncharacterized protein (TIGR02266 family)